MSYYECVFVARQDLLQSQTEVLTETYTKVLEDNGGKVVSKEYWGLKNLAYPIKKNKRGHYVLLNVDAPPAAIQEMERHMRFNEDVIRYLSIKVDALEEGLSIMMRQQDREGTGRDGTGKERFHGKDRRDRYNAPDEIEGLENEETHASK